MYDDSLWELEVQFLAEQWQPNFVDEVMQFYHKRMRALHSAEYAFAQTYARFFMSPSAEGAHQ